MSTPVDEPLEQAAAWFTALHDEAATARQREQWQQWHDASPRHSAAWRRIDAAWNAFAPLSPAATRVALDAANEHQQALRSRRRALKVVGGALSVGAVALVGWQQLPQLRQRPSHRTAQHEVRSWPLPDGGGLWLNGASAALVDYSDAWRRIQLQRGELLIETAADTHQPARNLFVDTAAGRLHALGTRFSVRLEDDCVALNVYAGHVAILTTYGRRTLVPAGHGCHFAAGHIDAQHPADPLRGSWQGGRLIAEGEPLGRVIAELAMHRHGVLRCDPRVAHLPVVASLPLDDSERALELLVAALPIRVHRRFHWWVTVQPR